ncbi:MAG: hypothetical protein KDE27_24470 [Planctomycetes bacterium]|nr:hypothetical protein [Planctomycetota bacterium]
MKTRAHRSPILSPLAAIAALLPVLPAQQPPALVADLNPRVSNPAGSLPSGFTGFGDRAIFAADDGSNGPEPWLTDTVTGATTLLADLNPGPVGSAPDRFTVLGNTVFFVADDGVHGRELWRSDGSAAGTALVLDAAIGAVASEPQDLTVVGSLLYFTAATANGRELWVSDGTATGTHEVADLAPGATDSSPAELTALGGIVCFRATTPATGAELWRSDGTTAGTVLLEDLVAGSADGNPRQLAVVGAALLFGTATGLWRTDGTSGGAMLVDGHSPTLLASTGTQAYFATGPTTSEVFVTDGTAANTQSLGTVGGTTPEPVTALRVAGQRPVLFTAVELWGFDGTALTPLPLILNGAVPATVSMGNVLYFLAGLPTQVPFRTDGTVAGTRPFLQAATPYNDPRELGAVPATGNLLFSAFTPLYGQEPWISNGTVQGTHPVADLTPQSGTTASAEPRKFVEAGGTAFLFADDGAGLTLCRSDGTTAGTRPVIPFGRPRPTVSGELVAVGTKVYFPAAMNATGNELWVSDGTVAGTHIVVDIDPGFRSSFPKNLVAAEDRLYFVADRHITGRALFVLEDDEVREIAGGPPPFRVDGVLGAIGRGAVLRANDDTTGREPWFTDGTTAGTVRLADVVAGTGGSEPDRFCWLGDIGLFWADFQIFATDGTPAGTQAITLRAVTDGPHAAGRRAYFHFFGNATYNAFVTLGRIGTTHQVPPLDLADLSSATALGSDTLLISQHGALLRTDGTAAGTVTLPASVTQPKILATDERFAWFTSYDGAAGDELWRTDGTAAGTARYADIEPGSAASLPRLLGVSNGRVFFSADTPAYGRELWAVDPGASVQSIGHGCSPAGGFAPLLAATSPVLGGTAALTVTDVAAPAVSVMLASLVTTGSFRFPNGQCDYFLEPTAIVLGLALPQNGAYAHALAIPADPGLAGLPLRAQAILLPTTAAGATTATPAVALVLGS